MNTDGIRLFILTAKHFSIAQAARETHTSRSTASRQLKQFQENLGTKLLKENGRGIELTKSGWAYLNEVSPIFSQLEALQKKYTRSRDSLALAGSHGTSTYLLPSLMAQFSTTRPSAKLELHTSTRFETEEMLVAGTVDIAIITNPTMSSKLFAMEPYRNEPLTAFVMANHALAQMNATKISELGEIRLVIRIRKEGQSRTEAELATFEKKGMRLKIPMRCGTPDAVKEAVRHGAGIGILYRDTVTREIEQGEFKAIQIEGFDVTAQSYIVYSRERPLSPLAREFLALLRTSAAIEAPVKRVTTQLLNGRRNNRMSHQTLEARHSS